MDHIWNWEAHQNQEPDYPLLHEIARLAIYDSESLKVASESLRSAQQQQEHSMANLSSESPNRIQTKSRLQLQIQIIQGLLARSESNGARVQNELSLAFHPATQSDLKVQVQISREAKIEAFTMKAIAIVTMTFLPATFISSLFGMPFFYYEPIGQGHGLSVSSEFWIYWALAIPLSLVT